jgi:hypothetical protein
MANTWEPERILLTLEDQAGQAFAMVLCAGGGYSIIHDGRPLPSSRWPPDKMEECLRELLRLVGLGQ